MKIYQVWLGSYRVVLVKANSLEDLQKQIDAVKAGWLHVSIGAEVKLWDHVPSRAEYEGESNA